MPIRRIVPLFCLALAACSPSKSKDASPGRPPAIEISLSGFQSDLQPARGEDRIDREYVLPSAQTLDYFAKKGFTVVRLPMLWERMQPKVNGPLDPIKLDELESFLDLADANGLRVFADLHAFGRREGKVLGTPALPAAALVSFWSQFAKRFNGRFVGYDIMNEPHDLPDPQVWPAAAQATVDAIRAVDKGTTIYMEGDDWSNAERWPHSNANLDIKDPRGNLIYSAHQYFDHDTSGQYAKPYDQDGADPGIGARRVQPFADWLRARGKHGQIGEYGVPFADPRWLPVLDGFLDAVSDNRDVLEGSTYWMAGDWADQYALTLQPAKGGWIDRPQMAVITRKR